MARGNHKTGFPKPQGALVKNNMKKAQQERQERYVTLGARKRVAREEKAARLAALAAEQQSAQPELIKAYMPSETSFEGVCITAFDTATSFAPSTFTSTPAPILTPEVLRSLRAHKSGTTAERPQLTRVSSSMKSNRSLSDAATTSTPRGPPANPWIKATPKPVTVDADTCICDAVDFPPLSKSTSTAGSSRSSSGGGGRAASSDGGESGVVMMKEIETVSGASTPIARSIGIISGSTPIICSTSTVFGTTSSTSTIDSIDDTNSTTNANSSFSSSVAECVDLFGLNPLLDAAAAGCKMMRAGVAKMSARAPAAATTLTICGVAFGGCYMLLRGLRRA